MGRVNLAPKQAVVLVALIVVSVYVGLSATQSGPGFPLDDGWIHQTYARNLAELGQWAYVPGEISTGSTSPLWTILLTIGYLLRLPYLLWAFALGTGCLIWLAWGVMALWEQLRPADKNKAWLAGLVTVLTWPLVWAAVSGMETLLFVALGVWVFGLYGRWREGLSPGRVAVLGLVAGLSLLTRPDGLLPILLITIALALQRQLKSLLIYLTSVSLTLTPYFWFNLSVSGQLWPNTLYAKQTEYAVLLVRPIILRFINLLYFSLGGPAEGWRGLSHATLLLLPGVVLAGYLALKHDWHKKELSRTLPLLWAGGHVLLYAWRLPVTYQHGRYLLAALPVWVLFGLLGWREIMERVPGRVLRQVATITFSLILILFLLLGAQAYANDVAFIENEMVAVAHWLNDHTPTNALIASHDIGAIGYFTQRPLLDLAGLITPDLVPLLADESAIGNYIQQKQADYLVTAPGWPYTQLVRSQPLSPLFTTEYEWTQAQGLNNMTVYSLQP